jgi:SAM-dependent methyltransferase
VTDSNRDAYIGKWLNPESSAPLEMVGRKGTHDIAWIAGYVNDLLGTESTDRILDLCCGNGLLTYQTAFRAHSVVGFDFSNALLTQARQNFAASNIEYHQGDALRIGDAFPEASFDKAYISFAFQYFEKVSGAKVLRGLHHVLKPGGILALVDIPDAALKRRHQLRAVQRMLTPSRHGPDPSSSNMRFYSLSARLKYLARNAATVLGLRRADDLGWWWKRDTLVEMAREIGFEGEARDQPSESPHCLYRFDAIFRRLG